MSTYIPIKLPGHKETVYFHKKKGKVYSKAKGEKELPYQEKWLKKIHAYASEMSDDYGQSWNDRLYDRTRKALHKKENKKTKKKTSFFW